MLGTSTLPPVASRGLCTATQINDFQVNCLGPTASFARCKAFVDDVANTACLPCIQGSAAGPAPVLLPANATGDSVFVNTFACGFLVIGQPACANPSASFLMCVSSTAIDAACRGADFIGTYTKVANYLCGP